MHIVYMEVRIKFVSLVCYFTFRNSYGIKGTGMHQVRNMPGVMKVCLGNVKGRDHLVNIGADKRIV
jgi:hypothetical protein